GVGRVVGVERVVRVIAGRTPISIGIVVGLRGIAANRAVAVAADVLAVVRVVNRERDVGRVVRVVGVGGVVVAAVGHVHRRRVVGVVGRVERRGVIRTVRRVVGVDRVVSAVAREVAVAGVGDINRIVRIVGAVTREVAVARVGNGRVQRVVR